MAKVETYTFINSQLDADFNITWNHLKGTSNVVAMWVDNTGIVRNTTDVIQIVDDNNVLVSCGGPITGDNTIILFYDDTSAFAGRKLFELMDITNYEDILATLKVAVGKTDTPTQNVPFSVLLDYFQYNLDVLRKSAALSDIPASELPSARAALQVLSIAQVQGLVNAKLGVHGGGFGSGLSTTNTAEFNPTQVWHPATKKYVDDLVTIENGTIDTATQSSAIDTDTILIFRRQGKVVNLDMNVQINGNATNWTKVGVVSFLPAVQKYGVAYHRSDNTTVKVGYVRIDTNGDLFVNLMSVAILYSFEIVYFQA